MAHTVITSPTLRLPQQVILQCFAVIFNKLLPSSVYSLNTLELKKLFPLVKLMCHAYHRSNMEKRLYMRDFHCHYQHFFFFCYCASELKCFFCACFSSSFCDKIKNQLDMDVEVVR
jgi:hypothetical protein